MIQIPIFYDIISETNAKIFGGFKFSGGGVMTMLGWGIFILISICGLYFVYWSFKQKKIWSRKITINDIVGDYFVPIDKDVAKPVKVGSGGFQVLYLKKYKSWKLAYGGRVGKNTHDFYIMPDGYWYSGMRSANLKYIDNNKGLIQVITTHPNVRAGYTSLQKMIDDLHKTKQNFWDKYGTWIMNIAFVLIAGVMLWLSYKEYAQSMATFSGIVDKLSILIDKVNILTGNSGGSSGLVPA